jgi:hypothetical protein
VRFYEPKAAGAAACYSCEQMTPPSTTTRTTAGSGGDSSCTDEHHFCESWANLGYCKKNPAYMLTKCAKSCQQCNPTPPPTTHKPKCSLQYKSDGVCRTHGGGQGHYKTLKVDDVHECKNRCDRDANCVAVEFQAHINNCELHYAPVRFYEPKAAGAAACYSCEQMTPPSTSSTYSSTYSSSSSSSSGTSSNDIYSTSSSTSSSSPEPTTGTTATTATTPTTAPWPWPWSWSW